MANFVFTYTAPGAETSVSIEARYPSAMVAPAQIWLRAIDHSGLADFDESGAVYDGAHHEYHHEWTINGEPLSAWSKPKNLVPEHNNPNKRFGREVGFVLPAAGSYVIDLTVTDRLGNTAVAFTDAITVVSPESFFPEADRIYIDPDGDYSGIPAASARYQTLAVLETEMPFYATNPTWVLLRRGKEHSLEGVAPGANKNGRDKLYFGDNNKVCYVSGFGTGDRPLITTGFDHTRDQRNAMFEYREPKNMDWRVFTGLEFDGGYDPETWGGQGNSSAAIGNGFYHHPGDYGFALVHDTVSSGTNFGTSLSIGPQNYSDGFHFMVADCEVDGWRDYGHFGCADNITIGMAGNYIHQKPNTPTFGDKNGISTAHGPIRIPKARYANITMNELFTRGGWDGNDQACLRLFPDSYPDQSAHVDRNTMIGGWEIMHLRRSSHGKSVPHNVVIERNLTVGTGRTAFHIYSTRSGLTVRDNLMVDLNKVRSQVSYGDATILLTRDGNAGNVVAGNEADPIAVYGNTYLNLMDAGADGTNKTFPLVKNDENYFETIVDENNVLHKPAGDVTFTDSAPLDLATVISGVSVDYAGIQKHFAPLDFQLASTIANGGDLVIPYADVTEALTTGNGGTEAGAATDQAYWQAVEGIDTNHQIYMSRSFEGTTNTLIFSERGHFTVTLGTDDIIITNTSGFEWPGGDRIVIMLDRKSVMPPMDTTYAISATVPLPRPQTGSAAIGAATSGRVSPKDFLLNDRGESPSQGALEPAP